MIDPDEFGPILRVSKLNARAGVELEVVPDANARAALAGYLNILGLRKLRLVGTVQSEPDGDWRLIAKLGATVVQPCVVTMQPVTTRIDQPIERRFLAQWVEPDENETEMDGDETIEPLGEQISIGAILVESLALHLPDWPRAPGAELRETVITEPGAAALTKEAARPFAGLVGLRDTLGKKD